MNAENIRVAIVDDNEADRERIRSWLANEKDMEIIAEWSDATLALSSIGEANPDIVFLDVERPHGDAFTFMDAIERRRLESLSDETSERPQLVFLTGCKACAVKAFEIHALDFVLKPLNRARFEKAVARARDHVRDSRQGARTALLDFLDREGTSRPIRRANRVIIRSSERVVFFRSDEIDWLEAANNYVRVHGGGSSHMFRATMRNVERSLDPHTFARIHRSAIVNIDRIRELTPWSHDEYVVTMNDGTRLHASRSYSDQLNALIEAYGLRDS